MSLNPETLDTQSALIQGLDLRALPASFYANPYPTYHALQAHSPVHRLPDGSVLVTRYADVMAVYRDSATFASGKHVEFAPKYGADSALYEHHTSSLVFIDPPLHTQVRKIMVGALTRRAIDELEPGLIELVDRLLDEMQAKHDSGQAIDLIEDFASAIPVEIIGNLLDVPHAERGPLRAWSLAILGALEPAVTPEQLARGNLAVTEFKAYLVQLVAARRLHPGDPAHDVLTRLIQGEAEKAADGQVTYKRLSENELLQNCIFILNAGHETTTNLIGNALVALTEWPTELARLRASPELIDSAIEEMLRFEASNQLGNRRAVRDCSIGGQPFPAGTLITLCIGAANRDLAVFEQPDVLDVARYADATKPTAKHLGFGFGIHQCVGLHLARLEGRVAVGRFLQRFGNYRLQGTPLRGGRARFRGFLQVPISVV